MAGLLYVTPEALDRRCKRWLGEVARHRRDRPLPDLNRAALLIVDAQRYFAEPTSHAHLPAFAAVLPRIVALGRAFRAAGRPVFATRHVDDPERPTSMARWWRGRLPLLDEHVALVPAILALEPDLVLDKDSYSAFQGTALTERLHAAGCQSVVIVGVATHLCCETTARQAFVLGFDVALVADGCASFEEELHTGALRGLAHGVAVVAGSHEVLRALGAEETSETGAARTRGSPLAGASADDPLELAIIGAGPAGLAAALQACRSDVGVQLFDPAPPGGWARTAERIENYPGFPGGIDGDRLLDRFVAQLELHQTPALETRAVDAVARGDGALVLRLDDGSVRHARAVIVATGTAARQLDAALERELGAIAVSRVDALPAKLDGWRILVVGGGEAAVDQALAARRRGAAVTVIARRTFRALPLLLAQAREQGVQLREGVWIGERLGAAGERPMQLALAGADGAWLVELDAVVISIGKRLQLPELPKELEVAAAASGSGLPPTDLLGCTEVPGLYVVGDARRGRYRQVAIAVGDGVAAAMHAANYLRAEEPWPRREDGR